jgi:hypothetical protein
MPENLPSSIRTTARTIATSPFSAAGTCKSSVSMLLRPRLCASSKRPAYRTKRLPCRSIMYSSRTAVPPPVPFTVVVFTEPSETESKKKHQAILS